MRKLMNLGIVMMAALAGVPATAQAEEAAAADTAAPVVAPSRPTISVATVAARKLSERIIASGLIGAVEEVQVMPLIEGQPVDALLADVGDKVEAGAVLAQLSTATLDLQRIEARAGLASAKAALAQGEAQLVEAKAAAEEADRVITRTTTLRENGTAPQSAWDSANAAKIAADARVSLATQGLAAALAQLDLAQARVASVELSLERTDVKAPVAGEIVARNAKVGAVASAAAQPMFVIVRDGALELRADVVEADLADLAPGLTVTLRAVGIDEALPGTVRLVEPSVDPVTRLGRVRISLDGAGPLRAGMFAEAEILVAEREGLAVPVTALGQAEGQITVMRVREGVVEVVPVKTGIRDGAWIEITEGLAERDLVVAKAGAFVREGDRVNPVAAN